MRLQIDSPTPLPGYLLAGVQPLEDGEDALGVARVDADAVVRHREPPAACLVALGADLDARRLGRRGT